MPAKPATYCHRCLGICTGTCRQEAKRQYDKDRLNDPVRALYKLARWLKGTRPIVLRRDPLCCVCGHKASTVADHWPLSARQIVAQLGVNEFFNAQRCRGLCKRCHDASTVVREGLRANGEADAVISRR